MHRVVVGGALVASLLMCGAASAVSTSGAASPTVSKIQTRLLSTVGTRSTWVLTANATDRDGDLVGGLVRIKIGAKGKLLSRRIAAVRGLSAAREGAATGAGITSATLAGKLLRVVFFANAPPGPLTVGFSVSDAHRHSTKLVVLRLHVSAARLVTIAATDASAAEPSGKGTFTVTRSGTTASALTVHYRVAGTATARTDYTALPGSVTIRAGARSALIAVDPIDDELEEPSETVIVRLAARSGYRVGTPSRATVSIADNDGAFRPPPSGTTVTIVATDSLAAEPSETGTFTVTRTGSTTSSLLVSYQVTGTATAGSDYVTLPGSLTIAAGASSATITVIPLADSLTTEPVETVVATLASSSNYTIGASSSATVTITNASVPTVRVNSTDPSAAEPSNTGSFTVTRTGSVASALQVEYSLGGSATEGIDYADLPGIVTIPAGLTLATVIVTPIDDLLAESLETVVLTLDSDPAYTVTAPTSATVNITDNDTGTGGTVTVAATDAAAAESPLDNGTFTVTRSATSTSSLVVSYTVAGTATAGADYTALSPATVTIPANATTATITVTPIDDTLAEGNETVVLTLVSGTGYTVGTPSSATVSIADNEAPSPTVTIAATDDAAEPSDTGTFTVTRSVSSASALDVSFTVAGTATEGNDYTALPRTVTIPPSATSATITVTPIDDQIVEGNETVVVALTAGTGYSVGTPGSATVNIADNDGAAPPTVTIVPTDDHAAEPNDPGAFAVTRTGSTTASLTVFYTVSGTATNGTDYTALSGSVVIAAGQTTATITVGIIDDALVEGVETVIATVSTNANYTVGTPDNATISIADND